MDQKELDAVLAQHELWLQTNGEEGQRGDLREERLVGLDFSGRNLTCIDLFGADCHNTNFAHACMLSADIRFANFGYADLSNAFLTLSHYEGASFFKAKIDSDWIVLDMSGQPVRER